MTRPHGAEMTESAITASYVHVAPFVCEHRETLLSMYAKIADGKRLDDLISLFLGSQEHPALR